MLALARKINESIVIDDNIEITVLEIKGDQVKLGINAPKDVPIYRKEIYTQIEQENKEASKAPNPDKLTELNELLNKNK